MGFVVGRKKAKLFSLDRFKSLPQRESNSLEEIQSLNNVCSWVDKLMQHKSLIQSSRFPSCSCSWYMEFYPLSNAKLECLSSTHSNLVIVAFEREPSSTLPGQMWSIKARWSSSVCVQKAFYECKLHEEQWVLFHSKHFL